MSRTASKQLLTMELSFHSKEDSSGGNSNLMQEVSYEEENSVGELIT